MRGREPNQSSMLCMLSPADRVPQDHPLREMKRLADAILAEMSPVFEEMYGTRGRPSIPPETLLKSSLLMALYSVRSERQFCEQLDYNLLYRWFLDMDMLSPSFDASTFSKNRERLMNHAVAEQFFHYVVEAGRTAGLMSREHFTVDGTLIEANASLKSFVPRADGAPAEGREGQEGQEKSDEKNGRPPDDPGNPTVNFHGEKRGNATHVSSTDKEARLMRKGDGKEAKLYMHGHALMENRNGLLVDIRVTEATGRSERETALEMLANAERSPRATAGGDKGYDTRGFVDGCRELGITPHIASKKRYSSLDARTLRWPGYDISQRIRKRVEEIFGWAKTIGGLRRTRFRGIARTQMAAYLVGAAYNLLRITRLMTASA